MGKVTITLERTRDNLPWEGCINSVNYRIERGVPVEVPEALAELIRAGEAERMLSESRYRRFTCGSGARLG